MFDPAGFLKNDEVAALKTKLNLLLYTHNHFDHFKAGSANYLQRDTSISAG